MMEACVMQNVNLKENRTHALRVGNPAVQVIVLPVAQWQF